MSQTMPILNELHFRKLAEDMPAFISVFLPDGTLTYVNPALARMTGKRPEALQGQSFFDFLAPDDLAQVRQGLAALTPDNPVESHEQTHKNADGTLRHQVWINRAFFDPAGHPTSYQAIGIDITDQKQAAAALQESEKKYRELFENVPVGLYQTTLDGKIIAANEECLRIAHCPPERRAEWFAQDTRKSYVNPDDSRRFRDLLLQQGFVTDYEFALQRWDGSIAWVRSNARLLRDEHGRPVAISGSFADVTARRTIEEQLLLAKAQAEAASQAKSLFLANMSHELRTPLNPVIGFADLLADAPNLDDEQREFARIIKRRGADLLGLISNILDLTQIESGRTVLTPAPINPRQVVLDVARTAQIAAEARELTFACHLATDLPAAISADALRLKQILANLLNNAVKFTARGGVELTVTQDPAAAVTRAPRSGEVVLLFCVRDTGIGLPPDKVAELFQPFVQAEMSYTRRFGGAGLGLAIARQLVEQMGGRIWATSAEGQGSTFCFTLVAPRVEPDAPAADPGGGTPPAKEPRSAPLRVLLVEDEASSRHLFELYLQKGGHTLASAEDGETALRLFAQQEFDLVLLDIQLPGMNGLDVARAIRADPALARRATPIVAVTAYATKDDRERFLVAGMNGYLAKPVTAEALFAAMAAALGR